MISIEQTVDNRVRYRREVGAVGEEQRSLRTLGTAEGVKKLDAAEPSGGVGGVGGVE